MDPAMILVDGVQDAILHRKRPERGLMRVEATGTACVDDRSTRRAAMKFADGAAACQRRAIDPTVVCGTGRARTRSRGLR